jgi:hypothetical protein
MEIKQQYDKCACYIDQRTIKIRNQAKLKVHETSCITKSNKVLRKNKFNARFLNCFAAANGQCETHAEVG